MVNELENKRIDELIEAIMKIARGDYSVKIEQSGENDIFDSLAVGIDMMTDDIRSSMKTIEEKNTQLLAATIALEDVKSGLERKVEERTAELQKNNEEMQAVNEELNSTTEELQATNEELRATAQELEEAKEGLEIKVKERTEELQEKVDELERFTNVALNRELRIAELKDKVKAIEKNSGEAAK